MRACDHYLEAERILGVAAQQLAEDGPDVGADEEIALAQVHATLALAGATALQAYSRGHEPELEDWIDAAGDGHDDSAGG